MSASLQGDDSVGYSVAKKLGFCLDQSWDGYKRKENKTKQTSKQKMILKVSITKFSSDVTMGFDVNSLFILVNFNHYYFTLIVRKWSYCHCRSYMMTWLGWGWAVNGSGVCLRLPLPGTHLHWLIITKPSVWGALRGVLDHRSKWRGKGPGMENWCDIYLPTSLTSVRDWPRDLMMEMIVRSRRSCLFFL